MKALEPKSLFALRYEVVRCISTGGMGAVYEVLHIDTQRRRALKVLLPSLLVDDEMRRRFALEAVITANISSEHLVEVFDAGIEQDSGCPFLAMELLSGQDLGKQLAKDGPMALDEVIELLRQAARALEKTHAAGIVHRDLKPENLFVTRRDDGAPKLKILDFGIAKLLATQGGPSTRALGTPLFMAPEQIDDTLASVGPAADLYGVGQIAYALLTGVPYFAEDAQRADNVLGILLAVARGANEKASLRAAKKGVTLPAGFDGWFAKATAREPADRFASARTMVEALAATRNEAATEETREPLAVVARTSPTLAGPLAANAAAEERPRWGSTELIARPADASQPHGAIAALPTPANSTPANRRTPPSDIPAAVPSNTASLDPTVTNSQQRPQKIIAPLLAGLALSAVAVVTWLAIGRNQPTATGALPLESQSRSATAAASDTASVTTPEVSPTQAAAASAAEQSSAQPAQSAMVSAEVPSAQVPKGSSRPVNSSRPGTPIKTSSAPPVTALVPNALPWEVRTPVKP